MNANITSPESIRSRLWLKDACSPMEFKTFGSLSSVPHAPQKQITIISWWRLASIGGSDLM